MKFEDLKITRQFLDAIEESGYTEPTEIQQLAIPRIMAGQDLIGIAQTGTGKTAAYLLPLLQTLKYHQGIEPRCLILVPTKELAVQVEESVRSLSPFVRFHLIPICVGLRSMVELVRRLKS